jgi:glycosyltransferase involved in cell wall biosynthesis
MRKVLFGVTIPLTANAFLSEQLVELAKQGWDVHLAVSPVDGYQQLLALEGVHVHPIPMKRGPSLFADLRSLVSWLRLIKQLRPNLVVASTPKAGLLGMLSSRIQKTPVRLYHVRGLRAEGLEGLMARISLFSEKIAISSATDVLCDSKSLLVKMRELQLLPSNGGIVLGEGSCNGVDIEHFRPPTNDERATSRAKLQLSDDDIVIGFVGRLAVDKGIKELVQAAGNAHECNQNVKLVLVGAVELEDADVLRETLEELHDSPWATLTGPITDPRSTYWAFDLFCSPSYREGFPIAILEAQASGLAVITTRVTGCVDSIEPDITGLLINARDSARLQSAIQKLEGNQSKRIIMGAAARKRAMSEFNMPMVQARFIDYLDEIALASRSI